MLRLSLSLIFTLSLFHSFSSPASVHIMIYDFVSYCSSTLYFVSIEKMLLPGVCRKEFLLSPYCFRFSKSLYYMASISSGNSLLITDLYHFWFQLVFGAKKLKEISQIEYRAIKHIFWRYSHKFLSKQMNQFVVQCLKILFNPTEKPSRSWIRNCVPLVVDL